MRSILQGIKHIHEDYKYLGIAAIIMSALILGPRLYYGYNEGSDYAYGGGSEVGSLGYITGNAYLALNAPEKVIYMTGIIDGITAESMHNMNDSPIAKANTAWFRKCMVLYKYNIPHVMVVFEELIKKRPDTLKLPAAMLFELNFIDWCKITSKPSTTK